MNKHRTIILFYLISLCACVKDKPNTEQQNVPNATHQGLIVCNEGSYGNNNGELSFIDQDNKTVYNHLYSFSNNKSLGDVAQSITLINNKYYITINNSNKIIVLDPNTYLEIATINPVQSPRYITQVSAAKAYVTSLYSNSIFVLDLTSNTIIKTIPVDYPGTERMILLNGYCYVTNWDTASNVVYQINVNDDSIEYKIQLNGRASHDITIDKNGLLWILSGNKYKNKVSYLTRYNPVSYQIVKDYAFDSDQDPIRLTSNTAKDTLYYINVDYNGTSTKNGLYKMGIDEAILPSTPFIHAQTNSYFWGLGFDSSTHHIFLSDPKGFAQQSTVYEYSNVGFLINQYSVGIGANSFLFK